MSNVKTVGKSRWGGMLILSRQTHFLARYDCLNGSFSHEKTMRLQNELEPIMGYAQWGDPGLTVFMVE